MSLHFSAYVYSAYDTIAATAWYILLMRYSHSLRQLFSQIHDAGMIAAFITYVLRRQSGTIPAASNSPAIPASAVKHTLRRAAYRRRYDTIRWPGTIHYCFFSTPQYPSSLQSIHLSARHRLPRRYRYRYAMMVTSRLIISFSRNWDDAAWRSFYCWYLRRLRHITRHAP